VSGYTTAGERLLGRKLETERRGGVAHYVTGQHQAQIERIVEDGEEIVLGTLGYVDTGGHAVLVACVLVDGERWVASLVMRAGQTTMSPGRDPEHVGFKLSDTMIEVLEAARKEAS
jgi:hypothetical protein